MNDFYFALINAIITVGTVIVSIAIAWGRLKEKLAFLSNEVDDLRACLYKPNGTNVYVPKEDYREQFVMLVDNMKRVEEKVDALQNSLVELKTKVNYLIGGK